MDLNKVKFSANFSANHVANPNPPNAEIVANFIKLGDEFGENVSISATTKAERKEKLRAVLYGTKSPSYCHN